MFEKKYSNGRGRPRARPRVDYVTYYYVTCYYVTYYYVTCYYVTYYYVTFRH